MTDMTQFYTEVETKHVDVTESGDKVVTKQTVLVPFIRQSERRSFKACQTQWNWSWNEGLTPRLPKSDARWFGTGLHLALAEWYIKGTKRGRDPHETWEEFCGDNFAKIATGPYFNPDEYVDARELGHEMIRNYLDEYGEDENWEIIATEQRYRYKLRDADGNVVGILVGTFDAVLRERSTGFVWMVDHKTERDRINTNHLVKDEQTGTYVSIATIVLRAQGLIGPNEVVRGIIFNFLRKAKRDTRPRNNRGVYCNKAVKADYVSQISRYCENVLQNPLASETDRKIADLYYGEDQGKFLSKMVVSDLISIANDLNLKVFGEESKTQPAPLFLREYVIRNTYERERQIERIKEELAQMAAVRTGQLAVTKAPGDHCAWCDFKEICDVDEQGGDVEGYKAAAFAIRDPYADHRAGAINSKSTASADKTRKKEVKKVRAF